MDHYSTRAHADHGAPYMGVHLALRKLQLIEKFNAINRKALAGVVDGFIPAFDFTASQRRLRDVPLDFVHKHNSLRSKLFELIRDFLTMRLETPGKSTACG